MSNITSSTSSKVLDPKAVADAILAGNFDFSAYTEEQKAEIINSADFLKESNRIDAEYEVHDEEAEKLAAQKKAEASAIAKTQKLTDASEKLGCGNVIDDAYVPNCEEKDEKTVAEKEKDAEELFFGDDTILVPDFFRANPEDGMHKVVLHDLAFFSFKKDGEDKACLRIELRDVKAGNIWDTTIYQESFEKVVASISFNNNGMLRYFTSKKKIVDTLRKVPFAVWTVKDEKIAKDNKIITYFDEQRANKRIYAMAHREEKAEEKNVTVNVKTVNIDKLSYKM